MIIVDTDVKNQSSTPALYSATLANIPAAGQTGRLFFATDTNEIYRDTGSAWVVFIGSSGTGGYVTLGTSQTITASKSFISAIQFENLLTIVSPISNPAAASLYIETTAIPAFRIGSAAGTTYAVEIDGGVNLAVGHNYRINGVNIHNATNNTLPVYSSATSTFINSQLSQSGTQIQNIGGTYYASSTASALNTPVAQMLFTNSTGTAIAAIGQRTYAAVNNVGLAFYTAPSAGTQTQRMTINASGNVGIGVASASTLLELSTDSASKPTTNTWTIASDERVKTDIKPYTRGLQEILAISPVTYKYNGLAGFDPAAGGIGIIAQQIKDIIPETVSTYFKKLNEEDEEETELFNFNSHAITFVLINAIKELHSEIQKLKQNG
jgi:hypothetical protein